MTANLRFGFICLLGAYMIWGGLPIYFRSMAHFSPAELLAHRIIWSVPTGLIFILLARNWHQLAAVMTARRIACLSASAVLIGANWMIYIWAVSEARVMEASLGYYVTPLFNVIIGAILFSDPLSRIQWGAVLIAAIGVAMMTAALGYVPWVALILSMTFGFYGVIRKQVQVDSRAGFLVEASVLAPFALGGLFWLAAQPGGTVFGEGGWDIAWLMLAGPITAVPLILFALGAKRVRLSTLGMMQYIAPTIQFLISVVVFAEPFDLPHAVAFACIWSALIIFTLDNVVRERRLLSQPA
jgi:chloramphenicol-sensitive protein RarD